MLPIQTASYSLTIFRIAGRMKPENAMYKAPPPGFTFPQNRRGGSRVVVEAAVERRGL
jgi:hypothetical protein